MHISSKKIIRGFALRMIHFNMIRGKRHLIGGASARAHSRAGNGRNLDHLGQYVHVAVGYDLLIVLGISSGAAHGKNIRVTMIKDTFMYNCTFPSTIGSQAYLPSDKILKIALASVQVCLNDHDLAPPYF
jgi:hypothetical protein